MLIFNLLFVLDLRCVVFKFMLAQSYIFIFNYSFNGLFRFLEFDFSAFSVCVCVVLELDFYLDFSKMRTIIYTTLLLCIFGSAFCKDEELQQRVNDYIDDFIVKATNGSGGFIDPLPLEELRKGFEREIGFVRVKGEAKLYNGKIHGLSTMKRKGNATVLDLDDMLIISTDLTFKKLNASYKGALLLNDAGPTISLTAKVGRSQVSMIIIAPAEGGKAEMMSFNINKLQDIRVAIFGLGPMGWSASIISTLVLNAMEKTVAKASSIKVMEHFMKEIEKVPFPGKPAE